MLVEALHALSIGQRRQRARDGVINRRRRLHASRVAARATASAAVSVRADEQERQVTSGRSGATRPAARALSQAKVASCELPPHASSAAMQVE